MRESRKRAFVALLFVVFGSGSPGRAQMGNPLYEPGRVAAEENLRGPLEPPDQAGSGEDRWRVEADITLHHRSRGKGKPMVLVHGGPGIPEREIWPALEPLLDTYQVHGYDQRGCGRSTRPIDRMPAGSFTENMTRLDRLLGIGAQIADLERIRRILGEERLVLVGHSYGAFLAALYAAEFPSRVEALVLVAPADLLVLPVEGGGLFGLVGERLPADRKGEYGKFMAEYFDFGGIFSRTEEELASLQRRFGEFYRLAYPLRDGRGLRMEALEDVGGWMVQAQFFSMGWRHDYRGVLEKIRARTLVLHGSKDLQPEAASRRYAGGITGARFARIEGAGHFPFREDPDAFGRLLAEFLEGTGRRSGEAANR